MTDNDTSTSQDELRERVPETVPDDVELFIKSGDEVWGRDDHGEFRLNPMGGTADPPDPDDYAYMPCGHVLKFTYERYGQTRYCTGMAGTNFNQDFTTCKHHKARMALIERADELFEHGHFAYNYINFAKRLSAEKFIFAMELMGGLLEQSTYDYETEIHHRTIDTEDSDVISEDAVDIGIPIPTNTTYSLQASELLQAALSEVEMNNMREIVFRDGVEKSVTEKATDMEGHFTDTIDGTAEHHLHLPISRLSSDIRDHLETGGVVMDDDEDGVTFQQRNYTLDLQSADDDADVDGQEDIAASILNEGD
jgi:hypothetical protein